jgi:hypothetical protein
MRRVDIKISGRKIEGYPTITRTVEFETIEEFIEKADRAIDDTDFGKVDCYVDDYGDVFNEDEIKVLEDNWFIID